MLSEAEYCIPLLGNQKQKNMKPLHLFSALLSLSVLMVSCEDKSTKPSTELIEKHIIPTKQAISMHKEFNANRTDLIQPQLRDLYNDPGFEDSKFVWFSMEELKAYMDYLEAVQKENPSQDVSGVRLYFAAYPNGKHKFSKQQTLFMVPTTHIGNVESNYKSLNHIPFSLKAKKNSLKGEFVPIEALMLDYNKTQRIEAYRKVFNAKAMASQVQKREENSETTEVSLVLNEGELAPPPKGSDY